MSQTPLSDTELQQRLESLETFALRMDEIIRIPGTKIRLGWDSLIGLLPGVGDLTSLLTHGYLIWHAHRVGVRKRVHARMLFNAIVDFTGGAIPVVGDVFDVFWRSNRKNVELLKDELRRIHAEG
ncbi:MAG: DUF4112 domain-containing protein [Pirellulaceae bacterium]|nr:DUF4112 domain-containing protein [Pirellulaceae bacterium]